MRKLVLTNIFVLLLISRPFAQAEMVALPPRLVVQSPVETAAELQIIGLSASQNTLGGSLAEINKRLQGLLEQIRQPTALRGELGETFLLEPQAGSTGENSMLLIGLGDSQTLTPQRVKLRLPRNPWSASAAR